jgi:hypothetical protein
MLHESEEGVRSDDQESAARSAACRTSGRHVTTTMRFVNERIPKEDVEKFSLPDIDKKFKYGRTYARDWTIDRSRDMYLRIVARGREERADQSTWTFYWKGQLLTVQLETISVTARGGHQREHERLVSLQLPAHLEQQREQVVADLIDALTAYKSFGVHSSFTSYALTLDR